MALPTSVSSGGLTPTRYGVTLALYPGDPSLPIELQSATGAASTNWRSTILAPANAREVVHDFIAPYSTRKTYFRARHPAGAGYSAGSFTATTYGTPTKLPDRSVQPGHEGRRRMDTFYLTDGILKQTGLQSDGTLSLSLMKGYVTGTANGGKKTTAGAWQDGAAVTFPVGTYQAAPQVKLFLGSQSIAYQPLASRWTSTATFSATKHQYVDLTAVNVTAAGFTPRARLVQQSTSLTQRTAEFTTGYLLNAVGEATSATLANAPAYNDQYEIRHKWRITRSSTLLEGQAHLTLKYESDTTGGYIERASLTLIADFSEPASTEVSSSGTVSQTITAAGAGTTDQVRIRVSAFTVDGTLTTAASTFSVEKNGGVPGVRYYTATTSTIYAPICPSTLEMVTWIANAV